MAVAIAVAVAALGGCGRDDDPPAPRLTAQDVDVLARQQAEARRLLALDVDDARGARRALDAARTACRRVASAGPVLRLTAPACRASVDASEALFRADAAADRCGTDDDACHRRTLVAYVDAYRPLATLTDDVRRAVAAARLSRRCLDLVAGPRSLADAERRAGAAVAEHGRLGRALYAADEDTVDRAYRTFTTQYRDVGRAIDAVGREGRRHAQRSAEDCRGDVDRG